MAITSLSAQTFRNLQTGAGVFLKGFDYSSAATFTDIFDLAMDAIEKREGILGATSGGGTFNAVPTERSIEIDGLDAPVIGSTVFDSWEITMTGTMKEITASTIRDMVATGEMEAFSEDPNDPDSKVIRQRVRVRTSLKHTDYIPSLTWIGSMLDGGYMLINMSNALSTAGMALTFADATEGTIPFTFRAHRARISDSEYLPFEILIYRGDQAVVIEDSPAPQP